MSILINKDTKVIVQGITGRDGAFHTSKMKDYGTNIVGGISPGKGGSDVGGIPVFDTVEEAVQATGATASVIFVHNHPSGDTEASEDDIQLTKRLDEAGEIVGIDVLDHIIIGDKSHVSLKREGLF